MTKQTAWRTEWPMLNAANSTGGGGVATGPSSSASDSGGIRSDDPILLQASDHPGMVLVSHPLTGNNYLTWRRSMLIAFGAKSKLGFVNGRIPEPDESDPRYELWKKTDCMLISWILNSLSHDIVDSFVCANSASELWEEIAQRYGESNGPLIYQLQQEISSASQGTDSVVVYFNRLKMLWDQYTSIMPLPVCDCANSKAIVEHDLHVKLMQFLCGLNETYDNVRNQILLMEPLPSVNKAYSMLLKVEKQRTIPVLFPDNSDTAAMMVRNTNFGRGAPTKPQSHGPSFGARGRGSPRRTKEEKAKLKCDHCGGKGHEETECFRLHGVPEWYKQLKDQRSRASVHMVDSSVMSTKPGSEVATPTAFPDFSKLFQQELAKYLGNQSQSSGSTGDNNMVDFVHFVNAAGPEE